MPLGSKSQSRKGWGVDSKITQNSKLKSQNHSSKPKTDCLGFMIFWFCDLIML